MKENPVGCLSMIEAVGFGVCLTLALFFLALTIQSETLFCILLWQACLIAEVFDPHANPHNPPMGFLFGLLVTAIFNSILIFLIRAWKKP